MMHSKPRQSGFTLVEMLLSMVFIAVLMIAIVTIVIQISSIYNKGISIKEVDQAGRSISAELRKSLSETTPFYADPEAGTKYLKDKLGKDGNGVKSHYYKFDWGGRLCLSSYTYVWNYGKAINEKNTSELNVYKDGNDEIIRFVKIYDPNAVYCDPTVKIDPTIAIELLGSGQHDLALHSFKLVTTDSDSKTGQQLYNIEFVIGTNKVNMNGAKKEYTLDYDGENTSCKPPSDPESDPNYCSVAKFKISGRSGIELSI